jgi:hypothetical protein
MPIQHELIADLESEIDALRDEAERCRKIDIAGKLAFALGCIILITAFVRSSAFALVIGIAAVLGSVALLGSNRRTRDEITAAIRTQEARRSQMIDGLELQDATRWHWRTPLSVPDPPT